MKIRYLNVDLEVESHDNLRPLVEDFRDDVANLYCGDKMSHQLATFETATICEDPDVTLQYFCSIIEGASESAKKIWDKAIFKVFDIGYESGLAPNNYSSEIRQETIARIAAIGASIRITIYPPSTKENKQETTPNKAL